MSIRMVSIIWDCGPQKQGPLLVMLALADYANDEGECWPSVRSIALKSRMTERGVQKILRQLEDENWIRTLPGNGRKGCNSYLINPERRSPPEQGSPRTSFAKTPNVDVKTPNKDAKTPNVVRPNHKEPSRTIKEPSEIEVLSAVASSDAARSFVAYRKKIRKPLSVTAAKRLANSLQSIFDDGGDPSDALGLAEERGWQSVNPDWYFNAIHGGKNERADNSKTTQRTDPALEQIARLAGVGAAPSNGGV